MEWHDIPPSTLVEYDVANTMLDPRRGWVCADVCHCINQMLHREGILRWPVTRLAVDDQFPWSAHGFIVRLSRLYAKNSGLVPRIEIRADNLDIILFDQHTQVQVASTAVFMRTRHGQFVDVERSDENDVNARMREMENEYHQTVARPFPLSLSQLRTCLQHDRARLASACNDTKEELQSVQLSVATAWWARLFSSPVPQLKW